VNARQAARLRGRLSARFPGTPVDVTPHSGGATIFIQHDDGYIQLTTGDTPGIVLQAMLGRDLRLIDGAGGNETA
jgi:hypothetical protein